MRKNGWLEFWLFMIGIVPLSFVFTWVYNNTHRSILAVILFHGMVNFTGELIAITERADTILIFRNERVPPGLFIISNHSPMPCPTEKVGSEEGLAILGPSYHTLKITKQILNYLPFPHSFFMRPTWGYPNVTKSAGSL